MTNELKPVNRQSDNLSSYVFGKVQPQAVELEEAVLGAILLDKEAMGIVVDILKAHHINVTEKMLTLDELKNADEIWVAVGLLNNTGLEFIVNAIPVNCIMNFIVGINLPTEPKALTKLLTYNIKFGSIAKISTDKFFHPKVYIISKDNSITAFVGSANSTNGGFKDNIEMSLMTKDNKVCKKLIECRLAHCYLHSSSRALSGSGL